MIATDAAPARAPSRRAQPVPPRRLALQQAGVSVGVRLERLLVVALLFGFSQALLPLLIQGPADPEGMDFTDPRLRLISTGLTGLAVLICALRPGRWLPLSLREGWCVALAALALASAAWSADPGVSLRRAVGLLAITAFGAYLASRSRTPDLLGVVATVLGWTVAISIVLALAVPRLGIATGIHAGAWQGAYSQKNSLGVAMVVSSLTFLLLFLDGGAKRWRWALGLGLSVALLLLSTSMTSLVILLAVVALLPLLHLLRVREGRGIPLLILALLAGATAAVIGAAQYEAVLTVLGRDPTLTGRTALWSTAASIAAERPWLGYGYSVFLEGPAVEIWRVIGWQAPNSHNGYLDLWLALGVAGVALFVGCAVAALARAVHSVRRSAGAAALWAPAYLLFFLLYNLTESNILSYNGLYWLLFVAAACTLARPSPAAEEAA